MANPKQINDSHDEKVLALMKEINHSETADKALQKLRAKEKGYLDDEFDLAYCLKDARINTGPLSPGISIVLLSILGIGLGTWLMRLGAEAGVFLFGFIPTGAYIAWLFAQKSKYFYKVISLDFDARILERHELKTLFSRLKNELGSIYLKTTKGGFNKGLKFIYDDRPTYFLNYSYSIGSGKNRTTYTHTLIIQEHKLNFPNAFCYNKKTVIPIGFFKEDVRLEGNEFNKEYKVYVSDAGKKVDAFYVLNPRLMAKLLEPEVKKYLKVFESMSHMLIIGTTQCSAGRIGIRTSDPIITYDEYKSVKDEMLKLLDLATDITDVLMREMVDQGDQRSIAKEV